MPKPFLVARDSFFLSPSSGAACDDIEIKRLKSRRSSAKEVTLEKQLLPHFLTISDNNNKILAVKTRAFFWCVFALHTFAACADSTCAEAKKNFSTFSCLEFQSGP